MEETRKGWNWTCGIPSTVESFYRHVLGFNSSYAAKIEERSFLTERITLVMRGALPANECLNAFVRRWGLPLPEINEYAGVSILSGTALEVFVEGNPLEFKKDAPPLGLIAENFTIELSCLWDDSIGEAIYDLPSSIPLLNVYGQVTDRYTEISKQAYLIDTIGNGEWPMHLRTLALPISDKVFYERGSHTIIRVGAVLGQRVLDNLKRLRARDFQ